jgi:hypothetical protein
MSYKEVNAAVMLLSAVVISAWIALDTAANGFAANAPEAAVRMLWGIGYTVAFNIVAIIAVTIVFAVVTREVLKDERADERDQLVASKAMRNGYFVLSVGVLGVLIWQALGLEAALVPYALFGISMLAGGIYAGSQLFYYRIG